MAEATILQVTDGAEPNKMVFRLQVDDGDTFTVPGFKTIEVASVDAHKSTWGAADSVSVFTSGKSTLDGTSNILAFKTVNSTTDLVVTLEVYGRD